MQNTTKTIGANTHNGMGLALRLLPCLWLMLILAAVITANAADYVLVVDTSGSMRDSISSKDKRIRCAVVQKALREYLPALPQPSRVCLIAFNTGVVSERELNLSNPDALQNALTWVDDLERLTRNNGQTYLWTTLQRALEVASRYSQESPSQPVVVRVLTDGEDNQGVTTLEKVLSRFPLVDGEHIRGNLVLLGDLELKTKLALPDDAFTTTKSTTWSDIFPPVVLWFPEKPRSGDEVRFVENTRSIYAEYEWQIDGRTMGREKVLLHRFPDAASHRVTLKVKGIQGNSDSSTVFVSVQPRDKFTVDLINSGTSTVAPKETVRLWARPSVPANRFCWFVNEQAVGSSAHLDHQFDGEGTFQVKIIAWSPEGVAATNALTIAVKEAPLTAQIRGPSQVTAGQAAQFAAEISGPCAKIEWRFGDGSTAAEKDPIHTFVLDGQPNKDFQVWLRIESLLGRVVEAGPHTVHAQIRQQAKPPVAAFRLIEKDPRAGDAVHLVDESQGFIETWEWRADGVRIATEKNPVIELSKSGTLLLTLSVRGPGGTNETSTQLKVAPKYTPVRVMVAGSRRSGNTPFTVQFTNLSTGDVRAWLWEFGDGQTSTNANPQHTFTLATNYNVAVTAYPTDGSRAPARAQLTIKAVKPWPIWAKAAVLVGLISALSSLAAWLIRRRQQEKLHLVLYWWPDQAAVCRRADLRKAGEAKDFRPDVSLKVRRIGATQNLVAEALDGACMVTSDGQESISQPINQGAQLVVRSTSGLDRAVAIAVNQKPRRPAPTVARTAAITLDSSPSPAPTLTSSEADWGWESASKTN